ncbi:MAG: hypothetical protein U1E65_02625 [Myxococcota bacterium]
MMFVETMRGWISTPEAASTPISFQVRAVQAEGGLFKISGLIAAPPFAALTEAEGTLRIAPFLRSIRYELCFKADDGRALTLIAEKTPSIFSPVRGMTWMPASIRGPEGALLASGEMVFSLLDLPSFLASFLGIRTLPERRLEAERRLLERRALWGER